MVPVKVMLIGLHGGVFFSTAFSKPKFFASKVHPRAVSEWSRDMKHIIGPVELYAVIAARLHWHQFISGQCIVYYVDNYPVLDALIKGTSTAVTFRDLLACYERKELHGFSWAWFSRVPSESNCADAPSRGEYQGLVNRGWTHDRCACPIFGDLLEDLWWAPHSRIIIGVKLRTVSPQLQMSDERFAYSPHAVIASSA